MHTKKNSSKKITCLFIYRQVKGVNLHVKEENCTDMVCSIIASVILLTQAML